MFARPENEWMVQKGLLLGQSHRAYLSCLREMICGCDKARVMAELKFKAGLSLARAERVEWPVWWHRAAKLMCVMRDCIAKLAC